MILTGVFIFLVDYRVGLLYLCATPILLYLIDRQFKGVQHFRQKFHHEYEESMRALSQSLYNVETVKNYVQEEREARLHSQHLADYCRYHEMRSKNEFSHILTRDTLSNLARAGSLALSVWLALKGQLSPGDLVLIFTLTEKAFINLHRLGRVYNFMGDTHEALDRALEVQNTQNDLPDVGDKPCPTGDITFKQVTFEYSKGSVIKDVSLTIENKKITALIGPSGAGKTTLVKLIMRHYDPTSGSIALDGTDLCSISLQDLRKRIAFVSQHTEIFDRTVLENIAYARPSASRAEVIIAAKKAHAHEFIMQFKDGYDTIVGERGVRLSGGQRQRLSIARALLANPDIIIFDEATSSLDSESEKAIQSAVLSMKGKTLVVIAHRLSTIQHADTIVVMADGKVLETGSHKALMQKKGSLYKRMRSLQELGELRD